MGPAPTSKQPSPSYFMSLRCKHPSARAVNKFEDQAPMSSPAVLKPLGFVVLVALASLAHGKVSGLLFAAPAEEV